MTSDPEKSKAFYGELFGWTAEAAGEEYGGYITFAKDGKSVAGAMRNDPATGVPDVWSVYLATADIQATRDAAVVSGATVIVEPMPVPETGHMGMVADPTGAAIGLWQPDPFQGFGVLAEAGAPSWFELHTRGYDAAIDFYRGVFGWDVHVAADDPGFRYSTAGKEDDATAGVMDASGFLPEGVPSQWFVYVNVEDADKALAQAEHLGGSVLMPAEDTPYGRLATVADPTGATFRLQSGG
jgi:predicted enzyme related to lactoylglutathione lyase